MVINNMVMEILATSVRVSWDRFDIPQITGHIVYYSQTVNSIFTETSVYVPSSQNSVVIDNLLTDMEYQFQIVATAEFNRETMTEQRSERIVIVLSPTTSTPSIIHTSSTLGSNYKLLITVHLYINKIRLWYA